MAFDWIAFFRQYNVEYVETGPNVSRGNVNIRCPFCGSEDPSHHMGVSLEGRWWGCWRNSEHRGASPIKLVQTLARCSYEQAARIVGESTFLAEGSIEQVLENMHPKPAVISNRILKVPDEFKPLSRKLPTCKPFIRYLQERGFSDGSIDLMSDSYDIRYCTRGSYKGRIIFLVYDRDSKLVGWSGRSIYKTETLRYKTLSPDPEKAASEGYSPAIAPITNYLLWQNRLEQMTRDKSQYRPDTLFLVEGPFDALKLSVIGRRIGVVATCLFTSAISKTQSDLLFDLRFRHRYIMLDPEMFARSLKISWEHQALGLEAKTLPEGVKDPGELTRSQLSLILK